MVCIWFLQCSMCANLTGSDDQPAKNLHVADLFRCVSTNEGIWGSRDPRKSVGFPTNPVNPENPYQSSQCKKSSGFLKPAFWVDTRRSGLADLLLQCLYTQTGLENTCIWNRFGFCLLGHKEWCDMAWCGLWTVGNENGVHRRVNESCEASGSGFSLPIKGWNCS